MKIECSAMNGEGHGIYRDVWMAWAGEAMWSLIWLQEALRAWCSMQCRWCPRQQQQHSTSAESTGLVSQLDQGDRGAALLPQGQDTGSLCHPPSPGTDNIELLLLLCLAEDDDKDPGLAFCQVRGREEGEDSLTVIWKNWFISGSTSCYAKHFVNHLFSSLHFH